MSGCALIEISITVFPASQRLELFGWAGLLLETSKIDLERDLEYSRGFVSVRVEGFITLVEDDCIGIL